MMFVTIKLVVRAIIYINIAKGAMAAFIANGKGFNANNGHVYESMLEYTADKPVVPEPRSANPIDFAPNAP